jgi:two-component system KDP operon response regulator KdpE
MPKLRPRLLVVDDELPIRRFLETALGGEDYALSLAASGAEALRAVALERPDLVLLDLGLPDLDGVEVIRRLREWSQVPIIVLSVREREGDKIAALDAGADDYLTKPFGIGELRARLRAALRRAERDPEEPVFRSAELEVDLARRRVLVAGREVQLTPTEYRILRHLVVHAGKVLTHQQLLNEVWGPAYADQPHVLRVNVSNLRRKIEGPLPRLVCQMETISSRFRRTR